MNRIQTLVACLFSLLSCSADASQIDPLTVTQPTNTALVLMLGLVIVSLLVMLLLQKHQNQAKIESLQAEHLRNVKSNEQRHKSIFETIVDGVIIIDKTGIIQSFNPAAEKMFGYHKNEVIGQNVTVLMHDDLANQHDGYLTRFLKTGKSNIIGKGQELNAKHKNGSNIPIELNIGPMEINGQTFFTGVVRNISQRIISIEQSNLLVEMLETSPDLIITFDLEGKVEFMNQSGRSMLGYQPQQDLSTTSIADFFPREEIDLVLNEAVPTAYMHGYWSGETKIINHKAEPVDVSQVLIKHETSVNGKRLYSTVLRDISSRIKSEQELSHAKERAEGATHAKSEFLATMSHEIRTPMNGVLGMTQVLTNTNLDEKQSEYVRTIYDSGQALLSIINDILDFSKIEAGKLELESIPFNLANIITDIRQLFDFQAIDKGIDIKSSYPKDSVAMFIGDPGRLRQVLLNLVSNSLKFTEMGYILIDVSINQTAENTAYISIDVSDTGIGIPTEVQQNLFNSFTQADASTTRKFGGTGLGLAICKHLIELMGGEISVDSAPGQGATFSVTLSLAISEPIENELSKCDVNNKHVLVAYTTDQAAELITRQLNICNLQTTKVSSLVDLRKKLEGDHPVKFDLIVMDRYLSGRHTSDVIKVLHKNKNVIVPNIVVWTQTPARNDGILFNQAGVVGYIAGHSEPAELKNILAYSIGADANTSSRLITKHNIHEYEINQNESLSEFSGIEILLVEDNEINQMVAQSMLEHFGIKIKLATNGKEAVAILAKESFRLVFMDCQMPIMDGYAATKTIRDLESHTGHHTTIVAMTANAMKEDRDKCIQSGMDDFIPKPFTQQDLHNMLSKWLLEGSKKHIKLA